jgi:histidinol dehydrogenase
MRILGLTRALENKLLGARLVRDRHALRIASRIVADVRRRGDPALWAWTKTLDGFAASPATLWIPKREIREAVQKARPELLRAARQAARNIRRVAERQLPRSWSLHVEPGVTVGQLVRPIDSVGCYIPGGNASLVSTLLMTAVPAQVAGVPRIVAVCPRPSKELLAVAGLLGVGHIARIGGAQAVAALAYGTRSIPQVEKICGPGNRYVTAAKELVSADCAIDLPAGPTEAMVLADDGNPAWIAADLVAQAEHAADAGSFLVTTSRALAEQVAVEVALQLRTLSPASPAHRAIEISGAILVADSLAAACAFVNRFAPEHLTLPSKQRSLLRKIDSSGAIFLGSLSAQSLGDFISGGNHVLPTAGWARRRGGLSAADFVKCLAVQQISRRGFRRLADGAETLAAAESLEAHGHAVRIRR